MLGARLTGRTCSFCGGSEDGEAKVVSGYGAVICHDCVDGYHGARVAVANGSPEAVDPLADMAVSEMLAKLELIVTTKRQVDQFLQAYVDMLRERRISWASIGGALGVSRQAAWERFSRTREKAASSPGQH